MAQPATPAPKPGRIRFLCGVCGAEVRAPFRAPPAESSPDLDMRPGEPARGTLRRWVDTCAYCDASAPDLTKLTRGARVAMSIPAYRNATAPRGCLPFHRWSMLCAEEERAEALLQAAWAADDARDEAMAARFRRLAAACWPSPMPVASALRLVDVLRRAGDLAGAAAQADALDTVPLDEQSAPVLAYQRRLIAAGDTGRHLLSSALPPPAHRPHVAQKQKAQRSFWAWLKRG